jgi:putative two-component system response regulator
MKKNIALGALLISFLLFLNGCSSIGDKAMNLSALYFVTAVLAAVILVGYLWLYQKKNRWFLLLLTSVTITNTGYWFLSTAQTLDAALMANRVSYFGSVFLPMAMLMIILEAINTRYKKWLPPLLAGISLVVFLVAASPGYLDIYYAEVSIARNDGITVLEKVYGPWHRLYLFYLLGYFSVMVASIVHSIAKKKINSTSKTP